MEKLVTRHTSRTHSIPPSSEVKYYFMYEFDVPFLILLYLVFISYSLTTLCIIIHFD